MLLSSPNRKYPPFPLLSYFSVVVCLRCLLHHILSLTAYILMAYINLTYFPGAQFRWFLSQRYFRSTRNGLAYHTYIVLFTWGSIYAICIYTHWYSSSLPETHAVYFTWARCHQHAMGSRCKYMVNKNIDIIPTCLYRLLRHTWLRADHGLKLYQCQHQAILWTGAIMYHVYHSRPPPPDFSERLFRSCYHC